MLSKLQGSHLIDLTLFSAEEEQTRFCMGFYMVERVLQRYTTKEKIVFISLRMSSNNIIYVMLQCSDLKKIIRTLKCKGCYLF